MQPLITAVRSNYTAAQVIHEIRDSPNLIVSAGCELLDQNLTVLEDITADFIDGSVKRSNYATLHGTASVQLSRDLAWGRAIIRPYQKINGIRFNLGAYYTNTPDRVLGTMPLIYSVECYDLLDALNTPTGEAYAIAAGGSYVNAIYDIVTSQGFTKFILDKSRIGTTLPTAKVWPLDTQTTWLNVINDLCAAIGYRGIWSDWDGYLRIEPYTEPAIRTSEWTYETVGAYTMASQQRVYTKDYYAAPNRWVAIRNNNVAGSTPVEGNGVYTYVNQYNGLTSVQARGGRIITSILQVDAADQAALVAQTQQAIETDLRLQTKISLETSPNPLHWHFDKLTLNDSEAGQNLEVLEQEWELPLLGGNMRHVWSVI
jgi:hypothetical protein